MWGLGYGDVVGSVATRFYWRATMYEYKEAVPSQALQVPDGPAYGGRARGTLEACAECRVDLLGAHIELLGDGRVVGLGNADLCVPHWPSRRAAVLAQAGRLG